MTVATLLAHVGVGVPRYVTVGGEIVLDANVSGTAVPLRLEPHRFHGGQDPAQGLEGVDGAWWNTDPEARMVDENAMRIHFPGFWLYSGNGEYVWSGAINTGGRGRFGIAVIPHADRSLPSVIPNIKNLGRPEGRRMRRAPHLYDSGALCVASTTDWDPTPGTPPPRL
jgi:hypothetical protein